MQRSVPQRILATAVTMSMLMPSIALADVWIDDVSLQQGDNYVGGGTASWNDNDLGMVDVIAERFSTDEDLSVSFNGGNEIDNFDIEGNANVEASFSGSNEVEDINAKDSSNVTINADEHNDFEEINASDSAHVVVNVRGETSMEEIRGTDDASIEVRGTTCQKRDVVNVGEGENTEGVLVERGDLTIDHVTIDMCSETPQVGSQYGNVLIDTSKVTDDDDNVRTDIVAGGTLEVRESVIDLRGSMSSQGQMTIDHSDVEIERVGEGDGPLVWSATGINLINEENGEVKEGKLDGKRVAFVDTGDKKKVDLKADGKPDYYKCDSKADSESESDSNHGSSASVAAKRIPTTADASVAGAGFLTVSGLLTLAYALRRRLS